MVIRFALAAACAAVVVGCGGGAPSPATDSTITAASAPLVTTESARGPVLDIRIAGGEVSPVNSELTATVGVPITLRVDSDADDELHVHAVPEHTFEVRPSGGQTFEFTVDVPGRVEVELHHLGRTVAIIQVRP